MFLFKLMEPSFELKWNQHWTCPKWKLQFPIKKPSSLLQQEITKHNHTRSPKNFWKMNRLNIKARKLLDCTCMDLSFNLLLTHLAPERVWISTFIFTSHMILEELKTTISMNYGIYLIALLLSNAFDSRLKNYFIRMGQ